MTIKRRIHPEDSSPEADEWAALGIPNSARTAVEIIDLIAKDHAKDYAKDGRPIYRRIPTDDLLELIQALDDLEKAANKTKLKTALRVRKRKGVTWSQIAQAGGQGLARRTQRHLQSKQGRKRNTT